MSQLPTPSLLPNIIFQVAHYKFITKPAASIAMIHSGMPSRILEQHIPTLTLYNL